MARGASGHHSANGRTGGDSWGTWIRTWRRLSNLNITLVGSPQPFARPGMSGGIIVGPPLAGKFRTVGAESQRERSDPEFGAPAKSDRARLI